MDLSIITINYKTPRLLQDLFLSLDKIRLANELDFEVILVNVTPKDGSEIMVKKSFPWVKQIVDRRNLGFSGNNNIGIAESSGRYILFLNSDTTVPQGTLSEVVRFMDQPANQRSAAKENSTTLRRVVDKCSTTLKTPGLKPKVEDSTALRRTVENRPVDEQSKGNDGGFGVGVGAATCYIELASEAVNQSGTRCRMDPDCHRGFPTPWASLTYFLGLEKLFPKSKLFGQYHQFYLPLDKTHEIDACAGAFLLLRREVGEKINLRRNPKFEAPNPKQSQMTEIQNSKRLGFRICGRKAKLCDEDGLRPYWWDEDFFFYGEDLDLCYRIKEAGYKIMFYPHVKIMHHKGASSGIRKESKDVTKASHKTKRRVRRETTRAMKLFYQKHYENKYPKIVTVLVYLGISVLEKIRARES